MRARKQTREQLLAELTTLRARVADLEATVATEREGRLVAETVCDLAAALTHTLDLDEVLADILANVGRMVPHDAVILVLLEDGLLRVACQQGYPQGLTDVPASHRAALRRMIAAGEPLLIPDVQVSPDWDDAPETDWVRAYVGAPLDQQAHVIGFLNLDSATAGSFTAEHARRLQRFATQAAIAINNARLYAALRDYAAQLEEDMIARTAEIEQSRERVIAILNSTSDAIILVRADGTIRQGNPAFDQTFGYEVDEMFGQAFTALAEPAYTGPLMALLDTTIANGQAGRIEFAARRKTGETFDADMIISPIKQRVSRAPLCVCSVRDITRLKAAEEKLRQALERERELGELKTRFVAMASHEFRTPLTTIVSSADLLEYRMDRMTDEQKRKHFRKVQDSARHMTQLLDDVLTIGKADAGWLEIRPAPLDLRVLCEDVLEEIQLDVRPGLSIRFTSEGACGGVIADEKLMRNILSNLLSNAVKYSPHGGTVHLDLHCGGEDITIRVQDEGIGVPEKDQPRLFESFHRAENVGAIKGTGLGLAIVKRAVGLHGGTVRFTSEEGIGTTFTVVIPRASTVGEVDR